MKRNAKKLTLSAMFLALGLVLPFLTGQIPQIGKALLPMHIPVFLCGLICGWQYGAVVGLVCPVLRSLLFAMPTMYPSAVGMAFELCTYGLVSGLIYAKMEKRGVLSVYVSMLAAMVAGRAVWGVVRMAMLGLWQTEFSFKLFLAGAFLDAIPGIILQLILVPAVMAALNGAGVLKFSRE